MAQTRLIHKKQLYWLFITLLLALGSYCWIDFRLNLFFHQHISAKWYAIGQVLSWLGNGVTYLPLLLLFLMLSLLKIRGRLLDCLKQMVFAFIAAAIIADSLKMLLGRARPYLYFQHGDYGFYGPSLNSAFWSMPSGHVVTATAIFISLSFCVKKWRYLCYLLIAVVMMARMITFHHYLSDAIIAVIIGTLCAYLTAKFINNGRTGYQCEDKINGKDKRSH